MGRAAPQQSIAGGERDAAGALIDDGDRQRAEMKLGLKVAQSAGAAMLEGERTVEPFLGRRPAQGGAWGMKERRHQAAAVSSPARKASR